MSRLEPDYLARGPRPSSWSTVSGSKSCAIASLCSSRAAASSLIACDCSSNARRCRSLAAFNRRATSRAVSARSPWATASRNLPNGAAKFVAGSCATPNGEPSGARGRPSSSTVTYQRCRMGWLPRRPASCPARSQFNTVEELTPRRDAAAAVETSRAISLAY